MTFSGQGFDHLRMKINRAHKHLKELDALYVAYCTDPYTITHHDNPAAQRYVIRCELKGLAEDIPLALGDAVYALRSGLDQLAWQLALLQTPKPSRDTMFPIFGEDTPRNQELLRKRSWDLPCEAISIIKELQPYRRGAAYRSDPLWQLNELSNIDKHRIPAGRSTDANVWAAPLGWIRTDFDNGFELSWPLGLKDSVEFKPQPADLIFGDAIHNDGPDTIPLELTRADLAEIYRYVRKDVAPRFMRFFPGAPNP